ncbi:carboxylesterase/lipase family protein [Edaphobacter modestus]|uniref:Carboxylic ester hydrolase n=1 Tax=Edaphobacter modestus TaxID=388466 RepID=A0A4Q7YZ15_9BACT|nr:carboxylesterase/lipase family protein [Edaphobacter modestus]RZU42399.1 para-nitrobenzyl esterase [Edaphobacter modestus]
MNSDKLNRREFLGGLAGVAAIPGTRVQQGSTATTVTESNASTIAETSSGKIRGYRHDGVFIFKGIPYGASTSGRNRFMAPQAPEPWSGVRNALQYGPVCYMQDLLFLESDHKNLARTDEDAFLLHRGSAVVVPGEDCLRLNVWTPEINGSHKRPVMVYMHGGGFQNGCGHDLLSYEGESLARNHDAVVVNHNHRLNAFGYLNLAGFGRNEFADSANCGLLDLVAVLHWVRDNILTFGGDPENVTIFGQSGGGGKVIALMAMPAAKGLFHRAIVQSGPYLSMLSPNYSHEIAEKVLQELAISSENLRELQDVEPRRLSVAAAEVMRRMPKSPASLHDNFGGTGWAPTVGGRILPTHPFDPSAPSVSADVPLMTGTNLNEFISGLDHSDAYAMTSDQVEAELRTSFGHDSAAILAAYRKEYPSAKPFALYATIAASRFRIPSVEQARRKAALRSAPAYSYLYSWRTPVLEDRVGTFHAAEISFVFDNAQICNHYSADRQDALTLSRQMGAAWVAFARTGDPNHKDLPHWPAYDDAKRATMIFDSPCRIKNDPEGEGLRLIAASRPSPAKS